MLPQFDLTFFPSQIFWLIICFGIFFIFIHFYFFPKLSNILQSREIKIKKHTLQHHHNLAEIEKLHQEQKEIIAQTKAETEKMIAEEKSKAKAFIEQKFREIDTNLNAKFEEGKAEIESNMAHFASTIEEEVLKSASAMISKIEEKPIKPEEIAKYAK